MPHGRTAAGARANCSRVVLSSNECYFMLMDRAMGQLWVAQCHFFRLMPDAKLQKNAGLPQSTH